MWAVAGLMGSSQKGKAGERRKIIREEEEVGRKRRKALMCRTY